MPKTTSDWIAADLGDSLASDNAEPLNLRSEASEAGGSNRSKIPATAISCPEETRETSGTPAWGLVRKSLPRAHGPRSGGKTNKASRLLISIPGHSRRLMLWNVKAAMYREF